MVNKINDHMCSLIPEEEHHFFSCDTVCQASQASDAHAYIEPAATDSRSPCPALNALANHGYV